MLALQPARHTEIQAAERYNAVLYVVFMRPGKWHEDDSGVLVALLDPSSHAVKLPALNPR